MNLYKLLESKVVKWLLVGMAMLPALLYVYLGSFSRAITDDYIYLGVGAELGPLQSMLHWRTSWMSSYSNPFLHGLFGQIGAVTPAIFPIVVVAIWTLSLTWLLRQVLALLQGTRHQSALAVSFAALIVAASIGAFYTPQSFYWYSGALPYTFPVALFSCFLALLLELTMRARSLAGLAGAALVSALIAFICAGFSELYLIFQLAFMSLLLMLLIVFTESGTRRRVLALVGGGWLGTMAGFAVQWTSPGRQLRSEVIWQYPQFLPSRHLPDLASLGLHDLYHMIVNTDTLVSFSLLLAAGIMLAFYAKPMGRHLQLPDRFARIKGRLPYLACLVLQLAFIPVIWTHSSDEALFLGRFSASYMFVVVLNLALATVLSLLILRFGQLQRFLRRDSRRPSSSVLMLVLVALALLALPQGRSVHITAQNHLFVTALSLLLIAWWEWAYVEARPTERWFALFALASTAVALLSVAALIVVPRYFVGVGAPRHWSAAAYSIVMLGLIWGFAIGFSCQSLGELARARLKLASAAVLVIAYATIVVGQLRSLPSFMAFASEWDERHELLLDLQSSGLKHVAIPRREFDLAAFILHGERVAEAGSEASEAIAQYYGFESIALTGDE